MGVRGVNFVLVLMAHQRHPDFLHYACFHEPRVVRMAKIVEAEVPEAGVLERALPGRFDRVTDRLILVRKDQPGVLVVFFEQRK